MLHVPKTSWTLLSQVTNDGSPEAFEALGKYCKLYEHCILAYFRELVDEADARDLSQTYFVQLVSKHRPFGRVKKIEGKPFRVWLKTQLHRLYVTWVRFQRAKKRHGEHVDAQKVENKLADTYSADKAFDEQWLLTVLDLSMQRLATWCAERNLSPILDILRPILLNLSTEPHHLIAARQGWNEETMKQYVHRMRGHFSDQLLEVVRETVGSLEEASEELDYLGNLRVIHRGKSKVRHSSTSAEKHGGEGR
ncbi:RNA polymerase sigma factor [Prosthecobacter sp.]|uniref:RNA polymerase sigma factor n=1 Tax=Prosthecobacter sp. TaxID=1965333 RepID=UPI0037846A98